MKTVPLVPEATRLLESLRSIGYSAEAAIADLIDNSITAGAHTIDIRFPAGAASHLAIIDDGSGMTEEELVAAMRHGSRSPEDRRSPNDLGRFGLGMKTASLSQCRCLTVVSRKGGGLAAARWDLDFVRRHNQWLLIQLEEPEIERLPLVDELRRAESGTMVLWTELDRLAAGDRGDGSVISARIDAVRRHLALVFHRYMSGEAPTGRIRIAINNAGIEPIDPFLISKRASQKTPIETFFVEGVPIEVMGFTLPHISKLRPDEIEVAGGSEGLRRQQGFYVYRNFRLIVWGTWFRLMRQEELTKLSRVRVDIPNSLDHLWTLDIKKATASPPEQVREQLRALVPRLCDGSRGTQSHRAKIQTSGKVQAIWRRETLRDGSIRYCVDRDHAVVDSVLGSLGDVERRSVMQLLRAVEESFPGEAFYNDRAGERIGFLRVPPRDDETRAYLEDLARQLFAETKDKPEFQLNLLANLAHVEPFSGHPELVDNIIERIRHEHGLG